MNNQQRLPGLTFINTRPYHQAAALSHLLEADGATTLSFPTLTITPANTEHTKRLCQQLSDFKIAIFNSANAIQHSQTFWPQPFPIETIIAIGPGTQNALYQQGIKNVLLPRQFNSEGLLDLDILQSLSHIKIIVFSGTHPKPLLASTLKQRGGLITQCECYSRQCPKSDTQKLQALLQQPIDGIISTSLESLMNLENLTAYHPQFKQMLLIVIHSKMKIWAEEQGWHNVIVAKNASDNHILSCITSYFGR